MAQCEVFPIRYIIELLNKQYRIVLTGKLSITCITFGNIITYINFEMQDFLLVVC